MATRKKTAKKKTAKKKTAKKKTAKKKTAKKKTAPVVVDPAGFADLLVGWIEAATMWGGWNGQKRAGEVAKVIDRYLEEGHDALALRIGKAVPEQRGVVLLPLAQAGHVSPEDAIAALEQDVRAADRGSAVALAASTAIHGAAKLESKEIAAVAAALEKLFDTNDTTPIGDVARAYAEVGDLEAVDAILDRCIGLSRFPDSLTFALWRRSPDEVLAKVGSEHQKLSESPIVDLEGWSLAKITELTDGARGTWARKAFGEHLMAAGRIDDAKVLMLQDPEWDLLRPTWQLERLRIAKEDRRADAFEKELRESDTPTESFSAWLIQKLEHGTTFAELWPLCLQREPDTSVMSAIKKLVSFTNAALDADPELVRTAQQDVAAAFAAANELLNGTFRTGYDRGVEGGTRIRLATLEDRVRILQGDAEGARASVTEDFKNVSTLLAHAKDAYARGNLLNSLSKRAALTGLPDLALKIAMKVSKKERPRHAATAVRAYLPKDVAGAVKAGEKLTKPDFPNWVLLQHNSGLLVELANAALGQ